MKTKIYTGITIVLMLISCLLSPANADEHDQITMAPDGTYVYGTPTLAPDGTFVGGQPVMTPDGKYIGTGVDDDND